MDIELRDKFLILWKKYFNHAELPVTFYFSDDETSAEPAGVYHCRDALSGVGTVREGKSIYLMRNL